VYSGPMNTSRFAAVVLAAAWLSLVPAVHAQEDFAEPIGEDDAPVGGDTLTGEDVGSAPIDGAVVGGEAVQDGGEGAPIDGAMIGGEAVQDGGEGEPVGGATLGGEAVDDGGEGAPVGGDTLY
jgi:hypothetical protein